jgi:hypothetical protein
MPVLNLVKLSMSETPVSIGDQPVDERTARTIQQQYQVTHQEEFLRLRAQVEALLSELQTLSVNGASQDSTLAH